MRKSVSYILLTVFLPLFLASTTTMDSVKADVENSKDTRWHKMEEAQKLANAENKKVLVYVYKKDHQQCQKMSYRVYSSDRVSGIINEHFYATKINAFSEDIITYNGKEMTNKKFAQQFNISSYPTILFLDSAGEIITLQSGFIEHDTFNKLLVFVGSDAYKRIEFDQFSLNQDN